VPEELRKMDSPKAGASGPCLPDVYPAIILPGGRALITKGANVRFHCWQSIFLGVALVVVWDPEHHPVVHPLLGWLISIVLMLGLFILWLIASSRLRADSVS